MKFCHNCGQRLDDDAIYCECCGEKQYDDSMQNCQPNSSERVKTTIRKGVIFTNLDALASKFDVSRDALFNLLTEFCNEKKRFGILYSIVDAGEFNLSPSDSWEKHRQLLCHWCNNEQKNEQLIVEYLFIVGGSDIIPMPCVNHYLRADKNFKDRDIDTDLPYSFTQKGDIDKMIDNMSLFRCDMKYLAGRLPLANDATVNDLVKYLNQDLAASDGINVYKAYGQCDPHWAHVSLTVGQSIAKKGLLKSRSQHYTEGCNLSGMFLTPTVVVENVDQVFDDQAQLYYFNMHGGNGQRQPSFYGESMQTGGGMYAGIGPRQLASCQSPNFVATEACYGGKHTGYGKRECMVHAALSNQSLIYVGSSRIAFGAVDGPNGCDFQICNADVLIGTFIDNVLEGKDAAYALLAARQALFKPKQSLSLYQALTLVEFNLFGDPTLFLKRPKDNNASIEKTSHEVLAPESTPLGYTVKAIDCEPGSMLQQVRRMVDDNIEEIHQKIEQTLYAQYHIEARQPQALLMSAYTDGRKEYCFRYKCGPANAPEDESIPLDIWAISDTSGNIKDVFQSKAQETQEN